MTSHSRTHSSRPTTVAALSVMSATSSFFSPRSSQQAGESIVEGSEGEEDKDEDAEEHSEEDTEGEEEADKSQEEELIKAEKEEEERTRLERKKQKRKKEDLSEISVPLSETYYVRE